MATMTVHKPKSKPTERTRRETVLFYTCIAPFILGILFFDLIPMGASLVLSFTKWDILTPPAFIGIKNYVHAFTSDPNFPIILKVTFKYSLIAVPLRILSALLLAVLLNEATRGIGFFRTAFYLPAIISSVAAAVLWTWI